jgi:hypothetical protein
MPITICAPATIFYLIVTIYCFKPHMRHSSPSRAAHRSLSASDVFQHNDEAAQVPEQALARFDMHPDPGMHSPVPIPMSQGLPSVPAVGPSRLLLEFLETGDFSMRTPVVCCANSVMIPMSLSLLGHATCQSSDLLITISPEGEEAWSSCLIGFGNQNGTPHTGLLHEKRGYDWRLCGTDIRNGNIAVIGNHGHVRCPVESSQVTKSPHWSIR